MRSNRIRTATLAAGALLAALSLTACSSDAGSGDSGKAGAAAPAAHTAAKQSPSPAAAPEKEAAAAGTGTDTAGGSAPKRIAPPAGSEGKKTTGSAHRTGGTTDRTPVTCTGGNTKASVSKVSRPLNHLLLTVTNTGDRPCYAYYAPMLRFDDAQAVFPTLESSRPQAVVTLAPGESAYAAIGLTGEPGAGPAPREAGHLQVHFSGKNPGGSTGTPAELTLPAGTSWDDNGFVTYWQSDMADALAY